MNKQNSNKVLLHIPNILTSLNIVCGYLSVIAAINNDLITASVLVLIAGVFDFLDGFAARILHAYSELGKQLDSLADIISFSFAPCIILFQIIRQGFNIDQFSFMLNFNDLIVLILPVFIVVFSALRLAKFNIDERQTESFIGLPTPANAIFIISLPVILQTNCPVIFKEIILNKVFLLSVIPFLCFMMVANYPMFSLKFKTFNYKTNKIRYIFLLFSVAILILMKFTGIPFIILFYIILSGINNWVYKFN